jgi:hypothetical protein
MNEKDVRTYTKSFTLDAILKFSLEKELMKWPSLQMMARAKPSQNFLSIFR